MHNWHTNSFSRGVVRGKMYCEGVTVKIYAKVYSSLIGYDFAFTCISCNSELIKVHVYPLVTLVTPFSLEKAL